jgi:hypothetical protein
MRHTLQTTRLSLLPFLLCWHLGGVFLRGSELNAQNQSATTQDAVVTMRLLRSEGHVGQAVQVMRASDSVASTAAADAIADSLTAFVLSYTTVHEWVPEVQVAVRALGTAGLARGAGRPYTGALERLMLIIDRSTAPMAGALYYVTLLPERARAVARVGRLAESANPTAHVAIEFLEERMGAEGLAELQRLSQQPTAVLQPEARRLLQDVSRRRGWVPPGRTP